MFQSLSQQTFKTNVDAFFYDDTNYPGIYIENINQQNTNDSTQIYGNPVFNVVMSDYTSYALVWYCQTLYYNTAFKTYLMLLLRSLTNVETTVIPLLPSIFTTINNLTGSGYDGDPFELTYHDQGICLGI